jgi:glycopeptide antibiotics resistance protein
MLSIEFGKGKLDRFGYLLITIIAISFSTILTRVVALSMGMMLVDYMKNEVFYNMIGALLGFMVSQFFIKKHTKALRKTYSRGSLKG